MGSGGNSGTVKSARHTKITEYSDDPAATISWTVQGRLVGEDQRRAIRISVSSSQRRIEILEGYDERVARSQDYPNTSAAFAAFARSLDNANFGKERTVKQPDERGICPQGNKYIYRLTKAGTEIMRTWSDTCLSSNGPFGGGNPSASLIQQLFKSQISDYSKFTSGVKL